MNDILGVDEKKIKEATFTANIVLFWLKADYLLTNKRVTGRTPNTFFGIVPFGERKFAQPLPAIASVASSTRFFFMRLIVGLALVFIGFEFISSFGIILVFLGIIKIMNSYTATFIITNNSGQREGYEISILQKSDVEEFVSKVNETIAGS